MTPFCPDGKIDFSGYHSLLETYLENGAAGLFAVCLSSEMYTLTSLERRQLTEEAIRHAAGRVPVVACGYLGSTEEERLASVFATASCGVAAVVIPACQLAPVEATDQVLLSAFARLLRQTGDLPLGLYECPEPYHRLFSAELLDAMLQLAGERLVFFKDTCCDLGQLAAKAHVCRGTSLRLYNANLPTFLESLRLGVDGYCGTSANFYPRLLAEMCQCFQTNPKHAEALQQFFNQVQWQVECKYPRSAKRFLAGCGAAIGDHCRIPCPELSDADLQNLETLREDIARHGVLHFNLHPHAAD